MAEVRENVVDELKCCLHSHEIVGDGLCLFWGDREIEVPACRILCVAGIARMRLVPILYGKQIFYDYLVLYHLIVVVAGNAFYCHYNKMKGTSVHRY